MNKTAPSSLRERFHLPALPPEPEECVTLSLPLGLSKPAEKLELRQVTLAPKAVSKKSGWLDFCKHAFVGASVSFVDASKVALSPVAFVWEHMDVIAKGFLYVLMPLLVTFGLFHFSPEIKTAYPPHSWQGTGFVLLMYAASAFSILMTLFSATFLWKGFSRLLNGWAERGQEALGSAEMK